MDIQAFKVSKQEIKNEPLSSLINALEELVPTNTLSPSLRVYSLPLLNKNYKKNFLIKLMSKRISNISCILEVFIKFNPETNNYSYELSTDDDDFDYTEIEPLTIHIRKEIDSFLK